MRAPAPFIEKCGSFLDSGHLKCWFGNQHFSPIIACLWTKNCQPHGNVANSPTQQTISFYLIGFASLRAEQSNTKTKTYPFYLYSCYKAIRLTIASSRVHCLWGICFCNCFYFWFIIRSYLYCLVCCQGCGGYCFRDCFLEVSDWDGYSGWQICV